MIGMSRQLPVAKLNCAEANDIAREKNMTTDESSLHELYAQWTTDRLLRSTTKEKADYRPEAVAVMLNELNKRGIAEENIVSLAEALPPPIIPKERDTLLLPARLNRKQYLIRWFVCLGSTLFIGLIFTLIPALPSMLFVPFAILALIYKIRGLDVPRLKNAGLSPWFLLLFLVPFANLVMLIFLFVAPPKK
jgi:hypothetical protein